MMLATNWGVYEICNRHAEFIQPDDNRDMEIRARDKEHLDNLRIIFPALGKEFMVGWGKSDFQYRVFISRTDLVLLMATLPDVVDYVQFKKDATTDKLHRLLSRFWSAWLDEYPDGSSYTAKKQVAQDYYTLRPAPPKNPRKHWWQ